MSSVKKIVILLVPAIIGMLFIYACGSPLAPFDSTVIQNAKDRTAPIIEIDSPVSDSVFGQSVTVTGNVSDDGSVMPVLTYTLTDALGSRSESGDIEVTGNTVETGSGGTFSFSFSTTDYATDILLTVNARDWNENESEPVTLRLIYSGSAMSSFKAVPGNKRVSLSWEPVEGAESYNIYYTDNGNYPSLQYGTQLANIQSAYTSASPLALENLENGKIYTFIINAVSSSGKIWSSGYIKTVPLSSRSLKPDIRSMYGSLHLSWQSMSADLDYRVYRAIGTSEDFVNISGDISDSSFIDSNVNTGTGYRYKIVPAIDGCLFSEAAFAEPCRYPYALYLHASSALTAGVNMDIDVSGIYAYLAQGSAGLQRVNISNKLLPNPLTPTTWTDCYVKAVDVENYYAYTADRDNGMRIYSYDKFDWGLKGICPTSHPDGKISEVVFSDATGVEYVYAGFPFVYDGARGGVDRITVESKTSPVISDTYNRNDADADYNKLAVSEDGQYLFAVYIDPFDVYFGMDIIRTSDMTRIYPPGDGIPALDVAIQGDYAYVVDGNSLVVYDVSDPASPSEEGQCMLYGEALEIDVEGDFAYVTEEDSGVRIVNIADPSAPVLADFYSEDSVSGIDVSGGYAYVAGSDSSLALLNVGSIFNFSQAALQSVAGESFSVALYGDLAFSAEYGGDLTVVDISSTTAPMNICTFTPLGTIREMQADGDQLYMSISDSGGTKALQIVDIANPVSGWNPDSYSCELDDTVVGFALKGDYLYLSNYSSGFTVIDVSDPSEAGWPFFRETVDTAGNITDCVIEGDNLYLLSAWLGIQVFDITDPKNPVYKGLYTTAGDAQGIDVQDGYVYVADGLEGLKIIDVSSPSTSGWNPTVYHYAMAYDDLYACDVDIAGEYAFVSYYDNTAPYDKNPGVAVIGIANPVSPHIVDIYEMQGENNNKICTDGETILVAADTDGLEIVDIEYEE